MPIDVICPNPKCQTRFRVSDKFAGKEGPCPKCKQKIRVPDKSEQVVVHAPEEYGPKDQKGQAVLKPIGRTETKLSPVMLVTIMTAIFVALIVALLLRSYEGDVPFAILAIGALIVAPPVVIGGYSFLRDDELEPYRGMTLFVRVAICSVVYAALWAVFVWVPSLAFNLDKLELFHLLMIIPPIAALGAVAALATLDLDFGSALVHYGLYVMVTVGLCLIMGVPMLGVAAS
jgi:hypothetical protein